MENGPPLLLSAKYKQNRKKYRGGEGVREGGPGGPYCYERMHAYQTEDGRTREKKEQVVVNRNRPKPK